eukprot:gnl/Trimastix_PCT/525.p1 GENE.gnl/Trimastix_PCT/525~~gnl/Trimastix_PCT/525.p1  ORF type:complete len:298 (-),score=43.49 gnl/Trimastix_PCT/525:32-886(-)
MGQGKRKAVGFVPHREKQQGRKRRRERDPDDNTPRQAPITLEDKREHDETIVQGVDQEVEGDELNDELSALFSGEIQPRVLVTTTKTYSLQTKSIAREIASAIPCATFYPRRGFMIRDICTVAAEKGFTAMVVLSDTRKARIPDSLWIVILPEGPTVHFRLSSLVRRAAIPNHGTPTNHWPELILNNMTTRLGRRVSRIFQSLFPQRPETVGRQVVTLHNQRDFIFFRFHRYIFESRERAQLQEIGPRFTLRLLSIQRGLFDRKHGEYEWLLKTAMKNKRRFFL